MASVTPAVARVTASDAAATHAYLKARTVLQRATVTAQPAELEALGALEAQVKAECPGVLASQAVVPSASFPAASAGATIIFVFNAGP